MKIEVTDSEYKIYFNGEPLSLTFPHAGREDMKTANHGTSLYITAIMQDHGSCIISGLCLRRGGGGGGGFKVQKSDLCNI